MQSDKEKLIINCPIPVSLPATNHDNRNHVLCPTGLKDFFREEFRLNNKIYAHFKLNLSFFITQSDKREKGHFLKIKLCLFYSFD